MHVLNLIAQGAVPVDPTTIETFLQWFVGYPLLGLFVWLYVKAQNQLITVQQAAAAAVVEANNDASVAIGTIYREMADQRRQELAEMRALLFDLARRQMPDTADTQPLMKAEVEAARAKARAIKAIDSVDQI